MTPFIESVEEVMIDAGLWCSGCEHFVATECPRCHPRCGNLDCRRLLTAVEDRGKVDCDLCDDCERSNDEIVAFLGWRHRAGLGPAPWLAKEFR